MDYEEVPVIRVPHSEPERRALALALNRLAEKAEWDPTLLKAEFEALLEFDANFDLSFDPEITGFTWAEIDQAIEANADADGEGLDDISGLEGGPAVSQYGDLFLAGEHRILHGDARLPADFAALMQGEQGAFRLRGRAVQCENLWPCVRPRPSPAPRISLRLGRNER